MQFVNRPYRQNTQLTTNRIEAFSDGVFAIAITLLILEIHTPTKAGVIYQSLTAELLSIWPSYFAYMLSFVTIGTFWVNHHYMFKLYQKTNHVFNLLNVFFLMCISFLPFPTGILARYLLDPDKQGTAIAFYTFGLLLPATAWFSIWIYACHRQLIAVNLSPRFVSYLTKLYGCSIGLQFISVVAALIQPFVGLAIAIGLALLFLLPLKQPIYLDQPQA